MPLTLETVQHIATLARLRLTEEEAEHFREQLSSILDYIDELRQLDTADIEPTATVLPLRSVMRADEVRESLAPATLLSNAPEAEDDQFRVPPVLE